MSYDGNESSAEYPARRISVSTGAPFDVLRRRLEALVPAFEPERIRAAVARGAGWEQLRREAERDAPYGLCRFRTEDPGWLMRPAGSDTASVTYLIGSLTLQARIFRLCPAAMIHVPLRLELHEDRRGRAVVGFEQPGAPLAAFGINKVTQAGRELDRMLGDLLEALELPRPGALRR